MPDITMCEDKKCPLREQCYRFLAIATNFRQVYFAKSPRKGKKCDYFWVYEGKTYKTV